MSEQRLSRASRNALKKLRDGKRMTNEISGYHWWRGRKVADKVIDPLVKAGLVQLTEVVSPKFKIVTTFVVPKVTSDH